MVIRPDRRRLRRGLLLVLFLLVPSLLSDLPLFSRSGHGGGPATPASALTGSLALSPLDRAALHPQAGRKHWHAGAESGAGDDADLLQNLVYLTHANQGSGGNGPLSDGGADDDHGWGFGGGGYGGGAGGSGGGAGAGGGPSGSPGYGPGTDFLPFDSPPAGDGGKDGGNPLFLSPAIPSIAAVPEPATWALFILGFGIIGARLRHARDMRLAPALTRAPGKRLG